MTQKPAQNDDSPPGGIPGMPAWYGDVVMLLGWRGNDTVAGLSADLGRSPAQVERALVRLESAGRVRRLGETAWVVAREAR